MTTRKTTTTKVKPTKDFDGPGQQRLILEVGQTTVEVSRMGTIRFVSVEGHPRTIYDDDGRVRDLLDAMFLGSGAVGPRVVINHADETKASTVRTTSSRSAI